MFTINIPNYQNRFVSEPQFSDYKQLLFRAGDILQGSEVNEIQNTLQNDFGHMSSRFITNGNFINGGLVSISKEGTGVNDGNGYEFHNFEILCAEGVFFFDGHLFTVPERKINYTDMLIQDADFELGVEIEYEIISFRDDSSLLEPANNIRNFGQPGADRLSVKGVWELGPKQEDQTLVTTTSIIDGVVIGETVVDEFDKEVIEIVAEYDRESRGNYLIDGHLVKFLEKPSYIGDFSFQIGEGKADIFGYKFKRNFTSEFILPELVDFELHQSEPNVFHEDGQYDLNHDPVRKVFRISGEKNITQPMDHGSYSGVTDTFPSLYTPTVRIKNVYQGATQYVSGRDYFQDGDSINWLTEEGAIEPAPNSSYTIEWDYRETQTYGNFIGDNGKINNEKTGITLLGYVSGSIVSVDYDFVLQRKDVIVLDMTGTFRGIKGVAREYDPLAPRFNEENNLAIAEVLLSGNNDPQVKQTGQRVFKMDDIEKIYDDIRSNEYNIGRMALKLDLKSNGNSLKNTFVDTFMDDSWRDAGIETGTNYIKAMATSGDLVQNINWETFSTYVDEPGYELIPHNPNTVRLRTTGTPVSIISQLEHTGLMQITALFYANAPKARLRVIPSYYSWIDENIFLRFVEGRQTRTRISWTWGRSRTSRQRLARFSNTVTSITRSDEPAIIPEIPLRLISKDGDFNSNEQVEINWGGKLIQTVSSDGNGKIDYAFNVPSDEMSGSKYIDVKGLTSNVEGAATFFAQPLTKTIVETTTIIWRWIRTIHRNPPPPRPRRVDPVAQSFNVETSFVLDSIKVWFDTAPTSDSFIEIVEITAGQPDNSKKLTSRNYQVGDISDNSSFIYDLEDKVTLDAGKSYAFVIGCEDPNAMIQIATMGEKTIDTNRWMTSQPYNEGVLFNSSNSETWNPLQTKDLRFEIFSTSFETERTFVFDPISVVEATDLMVLSSNESSADNDIKYNIEFVDGSIDTIENISLYDQISIGQEFTGEIQLVATMSSNGSYSPEMNVDAQIVVGKIDLTSTYTSRGFKFDPSDAKIVMYLDRISSGTAEYTAEIQILQAGSWNWIPLPLVDIEFFGDDAYEDRFEIDLQAQTPDVEQTITRVRLNLESSDVADRIILQSLRLNTLNL